MKVEGYRTYLVVNPKSAGGATGRGFQRIAEAVHEAVGPFEHAFTEGPGHATELTREALARGYEMVVGVGGDGTFNEVVGGFFDGETPVNPEAVFGVLPRGTGGDLRRTLGVPNRLEGACERLVGRDTRRIDVGLAEFAGHDGRRATRPFVNITSFGIGGLVVDKVNHSTKALGGKASFMIGSVKGLLGWADQEVTLRFDDGPEETGPVTNVAVCNGQFFGGGMWVAPEADLADGLFDVTIWQGYRLRDFALRQKMIYDGTHVDDPRTRTLRAKKVEARSDARVLLDLDGEQPGTLPVTLRILPGALRLKV